MRVALTGTPGVGKTTLAQVAAKKGWSIVDVKAWAAAEGCVVGRDEADGADIVDVPRLARRVGSDQGRNVLYEGHLSHLLPLDAAWVVRLDPRVLRSRLEGRGYPPAKVRENVEAEALDIILQEALDHCPHVVQRDGTHRTPEGLYASFAAGPAALAGGRSHDLEPVDWTGQLEA